MSRREEVERLVKIIEEAFDKYVPRGLYPSEQAAIDRLSELALESVPTQYVPREEVTEGWWSCRPLESDVMREVIWVEVCERYASCFLKGNVLRHSLLRFTDFLPIPKWLVEGL